MAITRNGLKRASGVAALAVATSGAIFTARLLSATTTCDVASMQAAAPKDTTIVSAEQLQKPVPHCKVEGYVTTTDPGPNRNNFRLQLPERKLWKGRFYFIGVGGSGGHVPTDSEVPRGNPMVKGFAVAGTDKGHQTAGLDWSFDSDPAKSLDNAHRGAHVTTVASQQLTKAYYGVDKMYRYHTGCSGGGGMGMSAIRYHPEDYDGVLLGGLPIGRNPDPKRTTHSMHALMVREMIREPGSWLSPAKLQFTERKVTEACDLTDGAKDGVIWDHRLCKFDFSTIKCKGADGPECLTQPEITSITNLLRDTWMPISNISTWTHYLGTEPPPWDPSPAPENRTKSAEAYVIYNGWARTHLGQPNRDIVKTPLTPAEIKKVEAGRAKVSLAPPDGSELVGFEKAGGKALFFNGVSDPCCSNVTMESYFRDLYQRLSAERVAKVAQLYQVPGWEHCGGGTGPADGQDKLLEALINWVEAGKAPQGIEMHRGVDRAQFMFVKAAGTTTVGVAIPPPIGPPRDFLVCPFPLVSVFDKSKANLPDAVFESKNWSCRPSRE